VIFSRPDAAHGRRLHHIDLKAQGFMTVSFDITIVADR
jgi:hypothetical protein